MGLTQVELAMMIKVPTTSNRSMQVHISRWESGRAFPHAEYLKKLRDAFGFKIVLFANGKERTIFE